MKSKKELEKISKLLSLVLRHKPEEIGIELDSNGYTNVQILLGKLSIDIGDLDWIVDTNNKKRFAFNSDKTLIRASQGHTIETVDLKLKEVCDDFPKYLLHGTSLSNLEKIHGVGLLKMSRNHVHLTNSLETAIKVGSRKGDKIIIGILDTKNFVNDGNKIYISDNGVYLTDDIEYKYLTFVIANEDKLKNVLSNLL